MATTVRLRRSGERGTSVLDGVGVLRRSGRWWAPAVELVAVDGRTAAAARTGWRRRPEFSGAAAPVWSSASSWRLSGTFTTSDGAVLTLRPTSRFRTAFALVAGDGRPLAEWRGGYHLDVAVHAGADRLLVLAGTCLVRWYVEDSSAAAGSAAAVSVAAVS